MATAAYASANYQRRQAYQTDAAEPAEAAISTEVTFVPVVLDIRLPVRKVVRAFQWRRRLSDYIGGMISGAVSLG